jgi:hypothetical protein
MESSTDLDPDGPEGLVDPPEQGSEDRVVPHQVDVADEIELPGHSTGSSPAIW